MDRQRLMRGQAHMLGSDYQPDSFNKAFQDFFVVVSSFLLLKHYSFKLFLFSQNILKIDKNWHYLLIM